MMRDGSDGAEIEAGDVLRFWLEDHGPEDWYRQDDALDAAIRSRFEAAWTVARGGGLTTWWRDARGSLAYIVLTDQFPRNMFRDDARAFATDAPARDAARHAIDAGHDLAVDGPARQFFYLPFMHSECLAHQDRSCRMFARRMDAPDNLLHAQAHRQVIRDYGRFPYRNAALGRRSTRAERAFLDGGSYGEVVRAMRDASDGAAGPGLSTGAGKG
ncbi:DUF924 family protein [uncultured Jannaschia sp.]|uniref:DUF924 family protein n=1 Tax=uncultured Jannaschia sp. TaxID=293347 RepID=UPI00261EF8C8|nr:DUF924 family protein [uncultured Jannaschia sp.]